MSTGLHALQTERITAIPSQFEFQSVASVRVSPLAFKWSPYFGGLADYPLPSSLKVEDKTLSDLIIISAGGGSLLSSAQQAEWRIRTEE
jgi:hypothetical protein